MSGLIAAAIVAAAIAWGAVRVAGELRASRADQRGARALQLLATFAPAVDAPDRDPRAVIVWQGLAQLARQLFPGEFELLDRASSGAFPFSRERLQAAHAHWTSEWLAWERRHDAEYKLKAAALEQEIATARDATVARARLDAVESEKLALYQRRYEEYVRVSKALQSLVT